MSPAPTPRPAFGKRLRQEVTPAPVAKRARTAAPTTAVPASIAPVLAAGFSALVAGAVAYAVYAQFSVAEQTTLVRNAQPAKTAAAPIAQPFICLSAAMGGKSSTGCPQ